MNLRLIKNQAFYFIIDEETPIILHTINTDKWKEIYNKLIDISMHI